MRLLRYTVNWTMHSTTVVHMVCCLLLKLYKLWGFLSGHQLEKPALSELLLNTQGIIHNIYTGELKQTRTWLLASWYTLCMYIQMMSGEVLLSWLIRTWCIRLGCSVNVQWHSICGWYVWKHVCNMYHRWFLQRSRATICIYCIVA